jgi:hypothetical protein
MSSISKPTDAALPTRARSLKEPAPRSPVGRLPSQRTITCQGQEIWEMGWRLPGQQCLFALQVLKLVASECYES